MKKTQREDVVRTIRKKSTKTLRAALKTLNAWERNHALKKNSWFWHENGNASSRSYSERKYTFDSHLDLGIISVSYWSRCTMSRAHVYWRDGLSCEKDGDPVIINFGDIRFFIDKIRSILFERERRSERRKEEREVDNDK